MTNRRVLLIVAVFVTGVLSPSFHLQSQTRDPDANIDITLTEGTGLAAIASPDRQSIAIDLLGALWVLPVGGGEAKKITPDSLEARRPSWSPDSRSLVFQGYGDAWHLYTIGIDGAGLKAVTSGPFDDREPDWSRDGRRIAFSSDRVGGISSIWDVDVDTGVVRQVSTYVGNDPCWSASDREVVFFGRDPHDVRQPRTPPGLWMANPDRPEQIVPVQSGFDRGRQPSPIVPCGNGRTFWPAAELRPSATEDVFPSPPQWLSESELLYTADGHVKRRTSVGGPGIVISFTARLKLHRPPYPHTHRDLQALTPQPVLGVVNPAVSPDGTQLAFVALGDLWVMRIGQPPTPLTDDSFVERDPAWSPDGTRLAFACDRGGHMDLWVHDFRTNLQMSITADANQGTVSAPAWSPNGQRIAYLANRRELRVVDVQTRTSFVWKRDGNDLGRPSWPPDGQRVGVGVLLSYQPPGEGTNQLAMVADDGNHVSVAQVLHLHHSAGNRINDGPVWSPEGTRLAYVTEGQLWVVAVGLNGAPAGDPKPITDDLPNSPSWQADAQHLVYLTPNGLRRVSADGGWLNEEAIPLEMRWQERPPDRLVVHAGALFDGRMPELRRDVDLVIERGRIQSVGPHQDDLHMGPVIDASNETLMPGLIDMHARLDTDHGEALGRLLLAYGVTSVRDPETTAYTSLEQRESYDAGRRIGPRVFVGGDPLTGARVFDAGAAPVTSDRQIERELERGTQLGFDFFSTGARLPDAYLRRLTEYAHAHGVSTMTRELLPAGGFGVDGVDGLDARGRRRTPALISDRFVSYRDVIDVIAKSGMPLVPMIGAVDVGPARAFVASTARNPSLLADPRLMLLPPTRLAELQAQAKFWRERPPEIARVRSTVAALEKTAAGIVAAGGRLVSGSGAPSVPYGLGLHLELEYLVEAGLTPFQALQTVTTHAAEALGVDDDLGTIEPNRLADLVFVSGDPLRDIKSAREVRRVMRGGRYYDLTSLLR